ncbi:MAG: hypothetical protein H6741_23595 [Alphaproteobacteria bacterium]|nr:hypothetical protein [Alphaproteobacteria bacterium]MCB9795692.1 hypothetical protein [Alphaproteobacteria bacterium]
MSLHIAQGAVTTEDASLAAFPGLVGIANLDDDDEDGATDWDDSEVAGENDYSILEVELPRYPVKLTLGGPATQVRVRKGGQVILGGEGGSTQATLTEVGQTLTLEVEFSALNSRNTLTLTEQPGADADSDTPPQSYVLALTGAPLVLKHHLQTAVSAHAIEGDLNVRFIEGYEEALGDRFTSYPGRSYQYDPWLQDEFEFASLSAPDAYMEWIIDSVRNGQGRRGDGLDNLAENEWLQPDVTVQTPGTDGSRAQSYDYFGNLEVSPPTTVDGVYYPFGRVYYGADGQAAPQQDLQDLLDAQQLQAPFTTPTSWLTVGHIDEFISTIPAPGTERGWKLVISDIDAAWEVLEAADPETSLTRWNGRRPYQGHGIETVGEIVDDAALRALNDEIQRDILDPALETFKAELGLTEDDVIRMPSLFEETGFGGVAALIPGMANLIVVNLEGETPLIFLADPILRPDLEDQSQDFMIADVRARFPEGVELVFLDDWFNYHMNLGEVHCGSKVQRTVDVDWWTEAAHLLEAE